MTASPSQRPVGLTIWFTGLPCSGKTTLALLLNQALNERGLETEHLDGDATRPYLSADLGFDRAARDQNIRRVGWVCGLLTRHGIFTTASFVSPYRAIRHEIRAAIGRFVEVYVRCPVDECIRRDVKGMYAKALRGEIQAFTGVSDPYEEPEHPEIVVDSDRQTMEQSLRIIIAFLEGAGYLPTRRG
jgi:adenylyl-sulfate kinase